MIYAPLHAHRSGFLPCTTAPTQEGDRRTDTCSTRQTHPHSLTHDAVRLAAEAMKRPQTDSQQRAGESLIKNVPSLGHFDKSLMRIFIILSALYRLLLCVCMTGSLLGLQIRNSRTFVSRLWCKINVPT